MRREVENRTPTLRAYANVLYERLYGYSRRHAERECKRSRVTHGRIPKDKNRDTQPLLRSVLDPERQIPQLLRSAHLPVRRTRAPVCAVQRGSPEAALVVRKHRDAPRRPPRVDGLVPRDVIPKAMQEDEDGLWG